MRKNKTAAICAAVVMMAIAAASGQGQQTAPSGTQTNFSRVDLFAGYSYWQPHGTVEGFPYTTNQEGMLFSGAYYFDRWAGLEVQGERHGQTVNNGMRAFSLGPVFRSPAKDGMSLFGHLLVGGIDLTGPNYPTIGGSTFEYNPTTWGVLLTAGGGADLNTPLLRHHLGIRLVGVDYQYAHVSFGPVMPTGGGRANLDALRLSAGLLYHIGSVQPERPIAYSCSASPDSIYPGDPVTVSGTATNLNPKKTATYSWMGDGGVKITGDSSTGNIDTANLSPGQYTVKGHVEEENGRGRVGDCTATFTVKQLEPPVASCAANPSTLRAGDTSTITANGVSPQNRSLSYSFAASAGTLSGTDNTATLSTAGAPVGPITVTCKVTDDKGQAATATTTVDVEAAPVAPPAPTAQALCSSQFTKDLRRPARVDNEAKACLDDVALNAQRQPDASLVLVGNAAPVRIHHHYPRESQLSAQRAVNAKDYLVREKGIDPSRIQVRTGKSGSNEVDSYLVPAGVTFDDNAYGTAAVDEQTIKHQPKRTGKRKPAAQ